MAKVTGSRGQERLRIPQYLRTQWPCSVVVLDVSLVFQRLRRRGAVGARGELSVAGSWTRWGKLCTSRSQPRLCFSCNCGRFPGVAESPQRSCGRPGSAPAPPASNLGSGDSGFHLTGPS